MRRFCLPVVATVVKCSRVGQVGKPDYLFSCAPLPGVIVGIVSPCLGDDRDVASS